MLRKAFHHEPLSIARKTDNQFLEIDLPRLSVALTGTPGQVPALINSAEDGLASRILFYIFKVDQAWDDVSPSSTKTNLTSTFDHLSKKVLNMFKFLEQTETEIKLTDPQWKYLNQYCSEWLEKVTLFSDEESASVVKRMGLIFFRFVMVFTTMRKFETGITSKEIFCTDADFEMAHSLTKVYLKHAMIMYKNLPQTEIKNDFKSASNKSSFFHNLPKDFDRKDIIDLAASYDMQERTLDAFLKQCLKFNKLKKWKPGNYIKVEV